MTPTSIRGAARPAHLCLTLVVAAALAACDDGPQATPPGGGAAASDAQAAERGLPTQGQVAARVNGTELTLHQVNAVLARLGPGGSGAAALEALIDQTLAQQQALQAGLDREPAVMQQLDMARRDGLARAWAERAAADTAEPDETELRRHFDAQPALYGQRRVYQFLELWVDVPPEQQGDWVARVRQLGELAPVQASLRRAGVRHAVSPVMRAAEQLSPQELETVLRLRPGERTLSEGPRGLRVWWLVSAQEQPLPWEQARPVIERQLMQQRRQERVMQALKALREQARIERSGEPAPAPSPATPATAERS